ncbi:MAG: LL-diaminopimelate aminotransferase [Elusimicrobia bacterium]|nr:LL-diaminopimelate aminotransferase [Elusimicrobiota bacterium]
MTVKFRPSQRLSRLPPYLFAQIDRKRKVAEAKGMDIISLGVGDPDRPTPAPIVSTAQQALRDPRHHQYPFGAGLREFREVIAVWFRSRFGVSLDPEREIFALLGSKEGLGHLPLAVVDPGDIVLVPEPGYPVYQGATVLAGATPYPVPLKESHGFLPDLHAIPSRIVRRAKLLFLNYPNNPTGAVAPLSFFREVVAWAKRHGVLVAHDAAYSELYFNRPPPSFLEVPGAKLLGVEFHSFSKTYNMTGWRVGWVCGNPQILQALARVKDRYDSGVFQALQVAAVAALKAAQGTTHEMRALYQRRRDLFVRGLQRLGWQVCEPQATFYVWSHVPRGYTSARCAEKLLEEVEVVCTPGRGFGPAGEGYVRFALTVEEERLQEAVDRIAHVTW